MMTHDPEFLQRLLKTFSIEAKEHIATLSSGLLTLEQLDAEAQHDLIETLFRETHSLKGASRSVDMPEVEELCKAMEEVFSFYKSHPDPFDTSLVAPFLAATDLLSTLVNSDQAQRQQLKPKVQAAITELLEAEHAQHPMQNVAPSAQHGLTIAIEHPLETATPEETTPEETTPEETAPEKVTPEAPATETLRIALPKLNEILVQSEELLYAKMVTRNQQGQLHHIRHQVSNLIKLNQDPTITPLLKELGQLVTLSHRHAQEQSREVGTMVDNLLESMKRTMTLPFSALYAHLPKTLYDMAQTLNKPARLHIHGAEVELDRRILEEMHDPIIHLLRNAIDHGIEPIERRRALGKPENATIELEIRTLGANKVELIIRDDGAGIDLQALKEQLAQSQGFSAVEQLDEPSLLHTVFQSGITTCKSVSDLSGRGLGLAIVEEKAQKLGGHVRLSSHTDQGTEFCITLPITLATFRGVLTRVGDELFIFPSEHIVRVLSLTSDKFKQIEGQQMLQIDHTVVPFYSLHALLERPIDLSQEQTLEGVVISQGQQIMAIGVDEILYEEEVMVKSLGPQLEKVKNLSGAAMIGTDQIALVLDIADLFKQHSPIQRVHAAASAQTAQTPKRILIVDDSATTRALLQNILEIAGFEVEVAQDGLEAFETLKHQSIDLVVSDVDMPRMSGVELTESIRKAQDLKNLPVILVTSLESPTDKQRGMEAGADAYIIKSTFDQNNLMEKIQWLIS